MLELKRIDREKMSGMPGFDGHEQLFHFSNRAAQLEGYAALHHTAWNEALGRNVALGGTRMQPGADAEEALALSATMSRKAVLAHIPFGGGKVVINADPNEKPYFKRDRLAAYAEVLNKLDGVIITGEDMGITEEDVSYLHTQTPWITGYAAEGESADPSPYTAKGVVLALEECIAWRFQEPLGISDLSFSVVGIGNVGWSIAEELFRRGAIVYVTDASFDKLPDFSQRVAEIDDEQDTGTGSFMPVANPKDVFWLAANCLVPCAREPAFTVETIPHLRCHIAAGCANVQLGSMKDGDELHHRDILYAPDYIVNAGGLICAASSFLPGVFSSGRVDAQLAHIPRTLAEVFGQAREEGRPPHRVAEDIARERIRERIQERS